MKKLLISTAFILVGAMAQEAYSEPKTVCFSDEIRYSNTPKGQLPQVTFAKIAQVSQTLCMAKYSIPGEGKWEVNPNCLYKTGMREDQQACFCGE